MSGRRQARHVWRGVLVVGGVAAYAAAVRPRLMRWGATPTEAGGALPGDDLHPGRRSVSTRAVTIAAAPEHVWPWLVQMGEGRGGWYSYDRLERLVGVGRHRDGGSATRIHADLQKLEAGDVIPFGRRVGIRVTRLEPGRHLVLGRGWAFVLRPVEPRGGTGTRLLVRTSTPALLDPGSYATPDGAPPRRIVPRALVGLVSLLLEPGHHVMERRMLEGIRARAERGRGAPAAARL